MVQYSFKSVKEIGLNIPFHSNTVQPQPLNNFHSSYVNMLIVTSVVVCMSNSDYEIMPLDGAHQTVFQKLTLKLF